MENEQCNNGGGCGVSNQQSDVEVSREANSSNHIGESNSNETTLDALCYEFSESLFEFLNAARSNRHLDCPTLHKPKRRFANSLGNIMMLFLSEPEPLPATVEKTEWLISFKIQEIDEHGVHKFSETKTEKVIAETAEGAVEIFNAMHQQSMTLRFQIEEIELVNEINI